MTPHALGMTPEGPVESSGLWTWGGRVVRATLIVLVLAFVAMLSIHPLNSYDVWTHLATGRLMWEEKRIPDHEPYSYTQNREMSLDDAAPMLVVRERVELEKEQTLPDAPPFKLVLPAGDPFDDEARAKLRKVNMLAETVDLGSRPVGRRLVEDAKADGRVVVPAGTVIAERHLEKLRLAGIRKIEALDPRVHLKIEPPLKRLSEDAVDAGGRVILEAGTLLKGEQIDLLREAGITKIACTVPWVNHEWLFQIPAYLSWKWWGMPGPVFFKTAVLMIAFAVVLLATWRRETYLVSILAVFLAALVSYKRFFMRPEVFSIMFAAVWIWVMERYRTRQDGWTPVWLLPILMIIWINGHGYFIIGILFMLIYLVGEGLQSLILEPQTSTHFLRTFFGRTLRWRDDVIRGRGLARLGLATLLVILATFLNPYGVEGARYPLDVLGQVKDPTSVIRTVIGEMQPPWQFDFTYAVKATWWLIGLWVASSVLNLRRLKFSRLLLCVFGLFFMSKALRNMPFFGIPAAICLGLNVNEVWPEAARFLRERIVPEALIAVRWLAALTLAAVIGFFLVWIPSDRFYVYDIATVRHGLGYTGSKFSMGAIEWVNNSGVQGNLFNSFGMGGLCMWKLYPQERDGQLHYGGRRLFIDGRAEVYGGPFVRNYTRSLGEEKLWNELDRKFNFQVVFVNWAASDTHQLIVRLYADDHWALCYGDGSGYVFVRQLLDSDRIDDPGTLAIMQHNLKVIKRARAEIENPAFLGFTEPWSALAEVMPGLPSREAFADIDDRIRIYSSIMCDDPLFAARNLEKSPTPGIIGFDRRYMTNGYDRIQRAVPLLPQRLISPGRMIGRVNLAMYLARPDISDFLPEPPRVRPPDLNGYAEAMLTGLIRFEPDLAEFHIHRGNAAQQLADREYQQARQDTRLSPDMRKKLLELSNDHRRAAVKHLLEAVRLRPDFPNLSLQLLRLAQQMGDRQLMEVYLRKSLDEPTTMNTVRNITAACLDPQLGLYAEALDQYRRAFEFVPERDSGALYERTAYCYEQMRKARPALENARMALDLAPDDPTARFLAWQRLGRAHMLLGDLTRARLAFKHCIELKPDAAEGWFDMGRVEGRLGNLEEAEKDFTKALQFAPGFKLAARELQAIQELRMQKQRRPPGPAGGRPDLKPRTPRSVN